MSIARRGFIKGTLGLSAMAALYGCAGVGKGAKGHVVVVGGGYGGATAAKYISMWSEGGIRVTLVERNAAFVSCPISNLVIAGEKAAVGHHDRIRRSRESTASQWCRTK
jgi:sulfide dehydrogenase [flavocytochrome c] flavoprotein subunit